MAVPVSVAVAELVAVPTAARLMLWVASSWSVEASVLSASKVSVRLPERIRPAAEGIGDLEMDGVIDGAAGGQRGRRCVGRGPADHCGVRVLLARGRHADGVAARLVPGGGVDARGDRVAAVDDLGASSARVNSSDPACWSERLSEELAAPPPSEPPRAAV